MLTKKHHRSLWWCFLHNLENGRSRPFLLLEKLYSRVKRGFLERKTEAGTSTAKGDYEAVAAPNKDSHGVVKNRTINPKNA